MTTFTIDNDNNITAHGTPEEAAAATATPFESFSSQRELAGLAAGWPAERLIAIWNGLPGVEPVKTFKSAKTAASRIWEPRARPRKPRRPRKATAAKKEPKGKKAVKAQETAGPREGSKTAQVVAMLQRKNGATLAEIMDKLGWLRHTVRGFMAGAMKKAGYTVESFKPEGGERTYRINK